MTRGMWPSTVLVALLCTLYPLLDAHAQGTAVILRAEKAFCDGDDRGAERTMRQLLADPASQRTTRFEAFMLLAEIHYQRSAQEQFLAATDSAAMLLGPPDGPEQEAWSRVEVNRSRYAFFAMVYERALLSARSALARFRHAPDRHNWKSAFRIHQALATAHRTKFSSTDVSDETHATILFAHFDSALALVRLRKDLQPYWEASVWRSISNAAMDRMGQTNPDGSKYTAACAHAQRQAIGILERSHPRNRLERAMLMNLRGLQLIYLSNSDSSLSWLTRSQGLIRDDVWSEQQQTYYPTWLLGLRWKTMVFEREPYRSDINELKAFLSELRAAQRLFATYAATQTTSKGLFTRDRYGYSPYTATMAVCQRLWQLTGDRQYIDQALYAAEKVRRDAWNNAQSLRGRPERQVPDPPPAMIEACRVMLEKDEGLVVLVDLGLGQVSHRAMTLVLTRDSVAFNQCPFNYDWAWALDLGLQTNAKRERHALHALHNALYIPVRALLEGRIKHLRVLGNDELAKLSFDAMIADTSSSDLRQCHPLVERYAINYPYFLLPPSEAGRHSKQNPPLYLTPARGTDELTDLAVLREAMSKWHRNILRGTLDSSVADVSLAMQCMEQAGSLIWGGHCGGNVYMSDEPIGTFSSSFTDSATTMSPSRLLDLHEAPSLVVHAACNSGMYHAYGSSGGISFARAFLFAGSRSVIASQHVADERSSAKLLGYLLEELSEGLPSDLALQKAKLMYLQKAASQEEVRALHWATWQLWGEPTRLEPADQARSPWPWLAGGALAVLAAAGISRVRRKT